MMPRVCFNSAGVLQCVVYSQAIAPLSTIGGFLIDANGRLVVVG